MITAGVDVGSNTVRMIIAEVEAGKILKVLDSQRGITRLGANIERTCRLSEESVAKTLELFQFFARRIKEFGVARVKAAATSAVREAANSQEFIAAATALGIPLETIPGDKEAYYTYLGVASEVEEADKPVLIYDIGGGSTEFIYANASKIDYSISIPTGVVKLSDKFDFNRITSAALHQECREYITDLIRPVYEAVDKRPMLIGTAGSVTTLAAIDLALSVYNPEAVCKHILTNYKIDKIIDKLAFMPVADRVNVPGIECGREDLIIPGALLVQSIITLFNAASTKISDSGLREGLAIAAAEVENV